MKIRYLIFVLLICLAPANGQVSGALDLAPKQHSSVKSPGATVKEIAVTSFGATPEGAEKRAISDAVRQAVGAYVDAQTITENDAVIKDRILSVSTGFVKRYNVTSPAKKTDDGLYEISVIALVETNEIAAALKNAKIISSDIDGRSLWAENSTKSINSEQARKMLEEKLPEFYKSLINIRLIAKDGNPSENVSPLAKVHNATEDTVTLTWMIEVTADAEEYKRTIAPVIEKCFEAIAGKPGKLFRMRNSAVNFREVGNDGNDWIGVTKLDVDSEKYFIVKGWSRSRDLLEGVCFDLHPRIFIVRKHDIPPVSLELSLKSQQGELITSKSCSIFGGGRGGSYTDFLIHSESSGEVTVVSPFFTLPNRHRFNWYDAKSFRCKVSVDVPVSDIKDVSKVEFNLSVHDFKVIIQ